MRDVVTRQTALLVLIIVSSILAVVSAVGMLSIVFGVAGVDGG